VADFEARLMQGRATVLISAEGLRILHTVQPAAADEALRTQRSAARPGWVRAEIPTETEAYAARQLLRLGTEVEVLAPPTLRAALAREAAAVARTHRAPARGSAPGSTA
jgi:predicted DNA-binding transcriptional regulator YafY